MPGMRESDGAAPVNQQQGLDELSEVRGPDDTETGQLLYQELSYSVGKAEW